nr:hypothetical protein [Tanacetum cinerariifolium]
MRDAIASASRMRDACNIDWTFHCLGDASGIEKTKSPAQAVGQKVTYLAEFTSSFSSKLFDILKAWSKRQGLRSPYTDKHIRDDLADSNLPVYSYRVVCFEPLRDEVLKLKNFKKDAPVMLSSYSIKKSMRDASGIEKTKSPAQAVGQKVTYLAEFTSSFSSKLFDILKAWSKRQGLRSPYTDKHIRDDLAGEMPVALVAASIVF